MTLRTRILPLHARLGRLIPTDLVQLAARIFVGVTFWLSARTKVEGLSIKPSTFYLFEHEYALPLIPPDWAAVLATLGEHAFSVLIIAGLCTRLSAAGLLAMTAVIQIFVYPEAWVLHGTWAASLLAVLAYGPGRLSVDRLLRLDR
ncbi:DoxX family protein [Pararhodobacter sp.]|uniref:DoxX family protein n=1 Tax=Pararhodobacter sp. TaxID=2127056 RepID=UPI002AFF26DA|nr:DoxX family protein [Pararhodobacter sp.]